MASRGRNLIATHSKVEKRDKQTYSQTNGQPANFIRLLFLPKKGMKAKTRKAGVYSN
jgi:hypothetical protein